MPRVFVILLNWNRPRDTLACLASLRDNPCPGSHIIVVDNGSADDSVKQIRGAGGDLILLESGGNLGFTGGNNLGMRYAMNHGADYLLVLNNDTLVGAGAIAAMVREAERDKSIGIVTPKICFHPQRNIIWFGGSEFNPRLLMGRCLGYGAEDRGQCDSAHDIPWATGCAMLIRRSVIEAVGYFWDDCFAVCEDIDYSLRVAKAGYRIVYLPSVTIWHAESMSSGGRDVPAYVYYQTRNYLLLHTRWASSLSQLILSQGYVFLYFIKRAMRFVGQKKWRSIMGLGYGIRDGLAGISGRREYPLLSTRL